MSDDMIIDLLLLVLFLPYFIPFILLVIPDKKSKKQLREEMVHYLVSSGEYSVAEAWEHAKKEYK